MIKKPGMLMLAAFVMTALWVTASPAVEYNLTAGVTTKTLPDGQTVTMWGFGLTGGPVTVPGPQLVVPPGEPLIIHLTNTLPEPVSIVIPGQYTAMSPEFFTDTQGRRRVRSLTTAAVAGGGPVTYTWETPKPGTFLYESGTHMSMQVPMGLYGAVKADSAANTAYPGIAYVNEVILLFSEIDPALHAAVAGGAFGTEAFPSNIDYDPRYYLVNGEAFPATESPLPAGVAGETTLLRLLNAGLRTRVPVVQGAHLTFVAEDGNPVPYQNAQYSFDLFPGKTIDALFNPTAGGYFPVFDRALGLSNAGKTPGGMVTYLAVGDTTVNLTALKAGVGSGTVAVTSLPGGIFCDKACTQDNQAYFAGTEIKLTASAVPGSAFAGWLGCDNVTASGDCLATMTADRSVTASFLQVLSRAGAFRQGVWFLDDGNGQWDPGVDTLIANFGAPDDLPVSGDMNGDGISEIGAFRPGTGQWFFDLDQSGSWSGCGPDLCLTQFGAATDLPITGDMDGDGISEIGVFRPGTGQWFFDLDHSGTWNGCGIADLCLAQFGATGDLPVTGDWDGDGRDEVGTFRQGQWFLDNGDGKWDPGVDTAIANFGVSTDIPVSGDVDSDGVTEIGTFRKATGQWFFDLDHSGSWNGCGPDKCLAQFGAATDIPVTGNW
ncbi:MAG TPA: multicopper oxidase domain-containing protein [Desulfuromonadales bacterium]